MKKYNFLFIFFLINVLICSGNEVDSLLKVLDKIILERPDFNLKKELRMDSLRMQMNLTSSIENTYQLNQKLFKEYRHYNMDSALIIANRKYDIAVRSNNLQYMLMSEMNIAEILGIMGMYKESLDIVDHINKDHLDSEGIGYYYHLYHSIYSLLSENSLSQKEKVNYEKLISQYKDSLLLTNEPDTQGYFLVKNGKLVEQGKYDEALALMKLCYEKYGYNERLLGTIAYGLSDIYEKKGDTYQQKKYLAISAISDLKRAVKSYKALNKLALLLYKEGDIDRAYTYMKCSMEDAIFCRARFRMMEISESLPIIVAAYDKKMKQEKNNLYKYLILISVLSLVLGVSMICIYKQLKKLSTARQAMKQMNVELKQMNEDLNDLNKKLSESNQVKEEYIGYVFNLCSSYIDKLETYRKNINRKLKAGQFDDAFKMTGSSSLAHDELKDFFQNFDAIFLNLYPNFVEEFNSLLLDGEQIYPKADDILTPELRVYALIRLGITDSSKIAGFLHYSPQTVYNYTLKVRNKLKVSKEEFSDKMQRIGK
jgi:tetratricopeptide (TPR) repeat protein/DNA-binding CsgD family transcriptional regulator